jgi:hypothetical protein
MAPDHELSHLAIPAEDRAERELDKLVDQGRFSPGDARDYITGELPRIRPTGHAIDSETATLPNKSGHGTIRRKAGYESRHGDSELDTGTPQYHEKAEPLSKEEIERREAVKQGPGRRAAMAMAALATHTAIMRQTAGQSVSHQIALERARQDRQARGNIV